MKIASCNFVALIRFCSLCSSSSAIGKERKTFGWKSRHFRNGQTGNERGAAVESFQCIMNCIQIVDMCVSVRTRINNRWNLSWFPTQDDVTRLTNVGQVHYMAIYCPMRRPFFFLLCVFFFFIVCAFFEWSLTSWHDKIISTKIPNRFLNCEMKIQNLLIDLYVIISICILNRLLKFSRKKWNKIEFC